MKLQILSIPDCPNVAPLRQRLAEVLAGHQDVTITVEIINTPEQAARIGMHGSPTLLVNGIDPFTQPGQQPSLSCRLYRDENGTPTGSPSLTQLRTVLELPGTPPETTTPAQQNCCSPAANPALTPADDLRL